ncbi:MAG: GAF domain-containing protein [Candidatus Thermoplasmatota archaeon]|nr:GAF domain-containing protein [Candidatus Thermoplasmatota archaeon]
MEYITAEQKIQHLLQQQRKGELLQQIVDVLYEGFEKYSWVGIYLVRGNELILGPWKGAQATEHTRIPLGRGVCGAAATSGKTEVVDDVSQDTRYLSCFVTTRSEIVVPIKRGQRILGEIDIDSEEPAAFNADDVVFLEKVADMLSPHI